MKCPDCGAALTGAPLGPAGETNQSFRCLRCGGFFVNGWLVNRIKAADLETWPGIKNDGSFISLASDECPNDASKIEVFKDQTVPDDVEVKRCTKCGWYWFPSNNLFKFKPAQEAKVSYFKLWGKVADLSTLLLPVVAVMVLVIGTVASVSLVRRAQQPGVSAAENIKNLNVVAVGPGEVVVTFQIKSGTATVLYRRAGEANFSNVMPMIDGGWGSVKISGLVPGESYRFAVESQGVKTDEVPFIVGN